MPRLNQKSKIQMKPYNTTPPETNTAEEPALAYAYTHTPAENLKPREEWEKSYDEEDDDLSWLTPEVMKMIDERVEGIENGTTVLIPHEEVIRERKIWRKQRKERYATV